MKHSVSYLILLHSGATLSNLTAKSKISYLKINEYHTHLFLTKKQMNKLAACEALVYNPKAIRKRIRVVFRLFEFF